MSGLNFSLVKSYSVTLIILPSERVCSTSTTLYEAEKNIKKYIYIEIFYGLSSSISSVASFDLKNPRKLSHNSLG